MGPRRARRRVAEGVDAASGPGLREREREGVATGREGQERGLLLQLQEGTRGSAEEPDRVHRRGVADPGAPGSDEDARRRAWAMYSHATPAWPMRCGRA